MGLREQEIGSIRSLFFSGLGVRAVSRIAGVSTHTAAKYRPVTSPTQCFCGRLAGHSGRCAERRDLHENSIHSEALKRAAPIETRVERARRDAERFTGEFSRKNFPYIPAGEIDVARQLVRKHRMPAELREDIEADVVLGLLEGRFGTHEIEEAIYWIKRRYFEQSSREVAIDAIEVVQSASALGEQEATTDAHIFIEAADRLPDIERRVFIMSAIDGMTILEIAYAMNFTVAECGERLRRAYLFVRYFDSFLWEGPRPATPAKDSRL